MPDETFNSINQWQNENFPNATAEGILHHIEEEWEEFRAAATLEEKIPEAADLIILLTGWISKVSLLGTSFHIDTKMLINRARNWTIQPDGTGRHK
jgi:hypothetical protein